MGKIMRMSSIVDQVQILGVRIWTEHFTNSYFKE